VLNVDCPRDWIIVDRTDSTDVDRVFVTRRIHVNYDIKSVLVNIVIIEYYYYIGLQQ